MEEYLKRRRHLRTRVEKNKEKLERTENPLSFDMCQIMEEQLQELWVDLKNCSDDILTTCDSDDDDDHEGVYDEIVDEFNLVKLMLRTKLATFAHQTTTASTRVPRNQVNDAVKLPKLELPSFSGSYLEWTAFSDLFRASVHSQLLSGAQKLQYLKGALRGEALQLIQGYSISDANYLEAWNVLQGRYQNNRELVRTQIVKFVNQSTLKEKSSTGLRLLVDNSRSCVLALKTMGYEVAVAEENYWISFLLMEKLDPETRELWEAKIGRNNMPKWSELVEFLDERCSILSSSSHDAKEETTKKITDRNKVSAHQASVTNLCPICNDNHLAYQCKKFIDMSVNDRKQCAKENHLCFNCLRIGHDSGKCNWGGSCRKCKQKHSILLHFNEAPSAESVSAHTATVSNRAMMSTAQVIIENSYGEKYDLRALLDPGADVSFISEDASQLLNLKKCRTETEISGVGGSTAGTAKYYVDFLLRSKMDEEFSMHVDAYVMPKITSILPKNEVQKSEYEHLKNVVLADPAFAKPGIIDVLLGADVYFHILRDGRITGKEGHPVGLQTVWGFVVGGKCPSQAMSKSVKIYHTLCDAEKSMQKYWDLEEIPRKQFLTNEDKICEQHFVSTHSRALDGRYVVRLPFRENVSQLGISVNMAERRLRLMEKRLSSDILLKKQYVDFTREYEALGHMELISDDEISKPPGQLYYLPHHAIIKEDSSTTKLRVVFDASALTSTKISLNDRLMTGPKLQDDLFDLLIRFRLYPVALKADIAKMFRQIWVHKEDCDFQRILWRESPEEPIRHYRLLTVTYGTSVAPYLAKRCLQQLAEDEVDNFPDASEVTKQSFYMDDLMSSHEDGENAVNIQRQLKAMMQKGGFDLRKWISNSSVLLMAVPESMRETSLPLRIDESDSVKTLGLSYHPLFDQFKFIVNLPQDRAVITKRTISSDMGKVFDPMGWLAPVTISTKILYQQLWKANLEWDDAVNVEFESKWRRYIDVLHVIENIRIPRCLFAVPRGKFQLFGFSDASELAYGAVIYVKHIGNYLPQILVAKTKVAPTRQVSLPRLELCAALLLARLLEASTYAMTCKPEAIYAWTDSMIVLHWLKADPSKWKTFVANRVSEIQDILPSKCWHHVPGTENPADCISRGIPASELMAHPLWWNGPSWLVNFPEGFFEETSCIDATVDFEEKLGISTFHAKADVIDFSLLHKYSSLPKILRVTAIILRFGQKRETGWKRIRGPVTVPEIRDAMMFWVRLVQRTEFPRELYCLVKKIPLESSSRVLSLNPFIDNNKLVRVGGRLKKADIAYTTKHPVLLPKKHRLVELIIENEHLVSLHGGNQLVLANLQQRYWILGARDMVQRLIRKSVACCRNRADVANQMMGDLPAIIVNPTRPFLKTGVDYAGPITLRVIKGKGHKFYKGYIAIFICFVTRAVHIELVTELSSTAFIKALRRFCGRRGKPADIYCDNGRTFVGAQRQLRFTDTKEFNLQVKQFLAGQEINFHLNPPGAPHFGGLWEAGIKSLKHHLRRVLGNEVLNYEELNTLLIQIEACLNSRNLSPLTTDATDLLPLTPGHFLIGDALTAPPDSTFLDDTSSYMNNWKKVQKLYHNFWKRWSSEYLTRLQQRPKWLKQQSNISIHDLVLVKDERFPPLKWKLGRIMELHPGDDGLVRVVTLRTADGVVKRPITKICPLPLH